MFRSSKPAFLNVTVRNLPPGTTQDDVVRHINGIVLGAQPKVGPVVADADKRMLHTSVTLQLDSDAACRNACAALHGSRFYPLNPEQPNQSADLAVKEDFLGVTTVAEHDDAQFDVYFVHGLGGHAFRTWSTTNRVPPVMWPRDLLPEDVKAAGLAGRFSTIGYQAQALDTWSATTTIQHAARNLLVQIAMDRPEGSDRPIFFVCHSLGGLVICQAILNELYRDSNQTVRQGDQRRISTKDGQCLVKGIFFFGTPFEGSQLANHASRFVKFLGGNEALIDSLKFRADGLRTIVSQFNQLRNNVNTKIPILIAYEKAPLYGFKFVTRPESAMSVFEDVTSVGIDGDHKTMIKFPDRDDAGYRTVSQLLIRLIASTISTSTSSPPLSPASPAKPPEASFNPTLSRRSHTMSTISSTRTMPPSYSSLLAQRPDLDSNRPFSMQGGISSPAGRPQSYHTGQSISPPGASNGGGTTRLPFHHPPKAVHRANLVPVPEGGGGGTEDTTRLARLSQFDTVFVIDDSGSMNEQDGTDRSRWEVLIDSMKYIVDIVCHYDPNGVDVRFLFNDAKDESEIREGQRVLDLLSNEVEPDDGGGGTFMAQVLWMVLQDQLDRFEEFRAEMKRAASRGSRGRREARPRAPRKLNLICITDGEATDKEEVESTIVDAARRLDELKAPSNQIGIQFVQIGNNDKAAAWLKLLDDKLKQMYNVRDIVDTRPFNSPETLDLSFQQRLQRILLGAILREVDDEEDEEDQG